MKKEFNHSSASVNTDGESPLQEDKEPEGKYDKPSCPKNDTSGSEFNLSEKIWENWKERRISPVINVKDVKEFIKRLKDVFDKGSWKTYTTNRIIIEIDKLAGEKLI